MRRLAGTWTKITGNPILPHREDDRWDRYPSAPHILQVEDKLRMYYYGEIQAHEVKKDVSGLQKHK